MGEFLGRERDSSVLLDEENHWKKPYLPYIRVHTINKKPVRGERRERKYEEEYQPFYYY